MDRNNLNSCLLNSLVKMPNVKVFFNHKLTGADFRARKAWLEVRDQISANGRPKEIEIDFDFMIGADGAYSAVRFHIMKFTRMDFQQEYIDTLWCEFHIKPSDLPDTPCKFRISPNHLHIWPGKEFMFIAIPSDVSYFVPVQRLQLTTLQDGSFTCTLFLPSGQFTELENSPSSLPAFFDQHFPGVRDLIPDEALLRSFNENPHLPLISLKCKPYHFGSSGVIIGDAAHAMVPFYGQGMNAGMEDVRVLFSILDKHAQMDESNNPHSDTVSVASPASQRAQALAEYSAVRHQDAHTINDLALQNYVEMRASVLSNTYRLRKYLEELMSSYFPSFGWQTKYSRVSFSNERYSKIVEQDEYQGKVLLRWVTGLVSSPLLVTGAVFLYKYRKAFLGSK